MRITITNTNDNSLIYTDTVSSTSNSSTSSNISDASMSASSSVSGTSSISSSDSTSGSTGSSQTVSFAETLKSASGVGSSDQYSAIMTYGDIFEEAAATYGVDVSLLYAIAKQESDFNADATSASGAKGIMQLMPSTASELGVSDPYDPYESIMAGASYLSSLLKTYDGNEELALAAFNAGPTTVAVYGGVPPFSSTQEYVSSVLELKESGVTAPDTTYVKKTATDEQLMEDLNNLMEHYQNYPSYTEFNNAMYDILATKDYTGVDSKAAYADMLKEANTVINNIIEKES